MFPDGGFDPGGLLLGGPECVPGVALGLLEGELAFRFGVPVVFEEGAAGMSVDGLVSDVAGAGEFSLSVVWV